MRFALIGDPVSGSVSPAMHAAAYAALRLSHTYTAERVAAGALDASFDGLRSHYDGLNVTIPHKTAAIALVDSLSDAARDAGSVNTVTFRDGSAHGDSTDGDGFLRALDRAGRRQPSAVILGAGGAARAISSALARSGARTRIYARDASQARALANDVAAVEPIAPGTLAEAVRECDLLVSAVPASAWTELSAPLQPNLHAGLTVFDLVYRPRRTPLLEAAAAAGCATIEGVEMLIEQGALSFTIWTGLAAPVEAMRAAAYDALAAEPART